MSDTKRKIMAERTSEQEATSSTPPNGHILASKSIYSDEALATYPAPQSDNSRVSEYKSINLGPQTRVSPDDQCSSTSPSSHPSALTGSTKQEGDKTEKKSSDKSVSQHPHHTAQQKHNPQVGSLSPNAHRKTNNTTPLRCEHCNKFFSETYFDSETTNAVPLTKGKIPVCPDCKKKALEGSRMAPPTQTKNLESTLPTTGNSSAHTNNATAARSSQCCCMASHQLTTSQVPANMSENVSPQLLRTIKTEPPSEPYAAVCSSQTNNPHTYHNHTYQTKCSIYLTANLKPCGKRDKEASTSNQDSSSGSDQQNKKPKLDNSKSPSVEKGQSTTSVPLIKTEIGASGDSSTADVKPFVAEVKPSSNGDAKIEVKQETNPTESSSKSSFKFKSPTKPAPLSSSGANSHKAKTNCTSNTYMFEGSMLWKPVHQGPASSTSDPKAETPEEKSEAPSGTEKKEEDENTFCCEGSLFIKPLLPNEFAFEGTMFIKPDSPLLAQSPISFANLPNASGPSSMPQTTKTLTIQSVFTSSGQVISSISSTTGDKSEHASSNGNSQQTQLSTVVTTSCVESGSKCTVTSCCTNQITKESELKKKTEQDKAASAGLSQCQTSASGGGGVGGGGGGHTDFSVKSILSATDRRSSCDSRRYPQH